MKLSSSMQSLSIPSETCNSSQEQKDFVCDNNEYKQDEVNNSKAIHDNWSNSSTQYHVRTAIMSIGQSVLNSCHKAVTTNSKGTKRAHMVTATENNVTRQTFVSGTKQQRKHKETNGQPNHISARNCYQAGAQNQQYCNFNNITQAAPRYNMESTAQDCIKDLRPTPPQSMSIKKNVACHENNVSFVDSNIRLNNPTSLHRLNRQPLSKSLTAKNPGYCPPTKPLFSPFNGNPKMNYVIPFKCHEMRDKMTIAHVDHSNSSARNTSELHQSSVMPNNRREDPKVALRNIAEFNAILAQRKGTTMNNTNTPQEKGNWVANTTPHPNDSSHNMSRNGVKSSMYSSDPTLNSNAPMLCSPLNGKAPPPISTKLRKVSNEMLFRIFLILIN